MTRWIKNRLSNIFTSKARLVAPSNRFRPSMISLEDRTVPAGADLFADATVLTGTFDSDTGNNALAGGEVDEPNHAGVSDPLNSLWWQWSAPASGTVDINTFGSSFDTALGVYTGSLGSLVEVASNDDANSSQSQVLFEAVAGTTYRIAVDGFGPATGDVVLHLGMTQPNDNFANATVVNAQTMLGSNGASTAELDEPNHAGSSAPTNSVWWKWTPTESGSAEINTFGSDFDTALAVYTGSAVNSLTEIVSNDDAGGLQSQVFFNAVAGVTYYIAVDGFLNETGVITLNIPTAQPTNDPPVIAPQSFSLAENSMGGAVVGTVAASDPNAGQTLTYSIVGGSSTFSINVNTGQIQVLDGTLLNFETNPSFALTVQVTDNGTPALSSSATVTINLTNVNEAPTVGPAGPFAVAENSANGTVVGSVPSADPDAGDTRTYSIVGGNGTFAINSSTGQITVANSAALDFETSPTFNITVQVTDVGGLSATTSVTINLSDVVNENTPAQQYLNLTNMVENLRTSGTITNPQANKLQKNLESSERQFNKGNLTQAENDLMMFINQLNNYVNSGILTTEEAQPLIDAAQILLDTI